MVTVSRVRHVSEPIRRARRQHLDLPPQSTGRTQLVSNPYSLSAREMRVLYWLTEGLADKEIAFALGVTAYTVNKHVGAILLKMGVRSRTAAAVRAVREHIF